MNPSRWARALVLLVVLGLVASVTSSAHADTRPTVITVVNRADWCSVCKTHGERAGKAVMAANTDGALQLVINDLTSEETAKHSAAALDAAGVRRAMAPYTATGVLYFFDAKTKRSLGQVTVASTDAEIGAAITMAKNAAAARQK
ncbi:MAG: hypothetical protein K8W52_45765 [Deltaproteobacteria bacterium]|nr:hypothetical protein [Deltaproteobacteria bacterium]